MINTTIMGGITTTQNTQHIINLILQQRNYKQSQNRKQEEKRTNYNKEEVVSDFVNKKFNREKEFPSLHDFLKKETLNARKNAKCE